MLGLFNPPEVKESLLALDRVIDRCGDAISVKAGGCDLVLKLVKAKLRNTNMTVHSVKSDGISPATLAWLLVTNVAYDELSSGEHHTCRGMLSMRGKELLSLWNTASCELVSVGYQTLTESEADTAKLQRLIREAG